LTIQPDGVLQLRFDKQVVEDGNVLSSQFPSHSRRAGGRPQAQIARAQRASRGNRGSSIGALAVLVAVALSGCAAATAYVQQHAAGLAATALVAGTAAQVSGALINADELERRIEQRAAPDENKAKR
jgi:hypothetical protein